MKIRSLFCPVAFCLASFRLVADVEVRFANDVFAEGCCVASSKEVRFPSGAPFVDHRGEHRAQLYWKPKASSDDDFRPLGDPAPFAGASYFGAWVGRSVTIPGVSPGDEVILQVRVWNAAYFESFEESLAAPIGDRFSPDNYLGASSPFGFSYPANDQSAESRYMQGFAGITLEDRSCNGWPSGPYLEIAIAENESVPLKIENFGNPLGALLYLGQPAAKLGGFSYESYDAAGNSTNVVNLTMGSLSGILPGAVYTPRPNTYGRDSVAWPVFGTGCAGTGAGYGYYTISVRPSARRPYLEFTDALTGNTLGLVLRGFEGIRYRVEASSDCRTWRQLDEVVGTTSEVAIQAVVSLSSTAQFFRAVQIER